jgi:hypothetical protein
MSADPVLTSGSALERERERVRIGDQEFERCEMEKSLATG